MLNQLKTLIWVGSELGSIKSVCIEKNTVENLTDAVEPDRTKASCVLNWTDENETKILVGTKNGMIRTLEVESGTFEDYLQDCEDSPIVGLNSCGNNIISCTEKGKLSVFKEQERISENIVGDHIQKMKQNPFDQQFVATGGKENNLKVFDVENLDKSIFAAKNVKNDMLDLRVPIWVTDIDFINGDEKNARIITGTGDHCIKVYDPRKQRRPVVDISWQEYPITCISMTNDENVVIAGNTAGYMGSIDLRTRQQVGSFKGIAGSIRSLQCHKSQSFVACCGLDRFLRIYDIETKESIKKVYLKTRLTCHLMSNQLYKEEAVVNSLRLSESKVDNKLGNGEKEIEAEEEKEETELLWSQMEMTTEKKAKKSKIIDAEESGLKKKKQKMKTRSNDN